MPTALEARQYSTKWITWRSHGQLVTPPALDFSSSFWDGYSMDGVRPARNHHARTQLLVLLVSPIGGPTSRTGHIQN